MITYDTSIMSQFKLSVDAQMSSGKQELQRQLLLLFISFSILQKRVNMWQSVFETAEVNKLSVYAWNQTLVK